MKRFIHLTLAVLCLASLGRAATQTGRVTDPENRPLLGVSVVTNVRAVGTMTDSTGRYQLDPSSDVTRVTFSSVGYAAQQFRIGEIPDPVVLQPIYYRQADIIVRSDRAAAGVTPSAFSNYSTDQIKRDYTVGEFPLLLESTPNVYAFSDGGASLGYSYLNIRGFDDKRISTYINGVPLNDPEDQATYFTDLPDFASTITDIQVQRGVGNSLYGDASFGGSINAVTNSLGRPRAMKVTNGYGGYMSDGKQVSDIYRQSLEYSSGLVDGQWQFAGRYSRQKTGGYRENSWYEGWAYYFSVARIDPRMTTELYVYGGPMRMHLSYYGADRETLAGDRRYNPFHYDNETDNFNQPHYQLHNTYQLSEKVTLQNTLYYIRGKGYYEQFKDSALYAEYDIDDSQTDGETFGSAVRQQWVEKSQVGWNPRLDIEHSRGTHSFGGSFYLFDSDHWGQVVWAQHLSGTLDPRHRYYQYRGTKQVGSLFAQEHYRLSERLSMQATAQFRYQRYDFDQKTLGAFPGYQYDVDWLFLSPRLGINYAPTQRLRLYTNFSVSSRTPTDAAMYDASDPHARPSLEVLNISTSASGDSVFTFGDPTAKSERVYDLELGGEYRSDRYQAGVNFFWMDFRDEILPYGGINASTGLAMTVNADRSVHAGIECSGGMKATPWLNVTGNLSLNYNRVKDYAPEIDGIVVDFADKKIVNAPDYLGSVVADAQLHNWRLTARGRFVGTQYMELFNIDSLAIKPFATASLSAAYTLGNVLGGNLVFSGRVDNLFDMKYEASGYGGNYAYTDAGATIVGGWAEYYVAPERSFWTQVSLELF